MSHFLSISILVLCTVCTQAQLLPLELDQTITLPAATDVWDVVPHPNGYYLWLCAVAPDTETTRLFWGRSDQEGYDSLEWHVGEPKSITGFWGSDYEPYVVLWSQAWFFGWTQNNQLDSTIGCVYRLSDGQPTPNRWKFVGTMYIHPFGYSNSIDNNYRALTVICNPPPPAVSNQIAVLTAHTRSGGGSAHGYSNGYGYTPCRLIHNMLTDTSGQGTDMPDWGASATALCYIGTAALAYSGWDNGWSSDPFGHYSQWSRTSVRFTPSLDGGNADTLWRCSLGTQGACPSGVYSLTRAADGTFYCFCNLTGGAGIVTSPWNNVPLWTTSGPFGPVLAADVAVGPTEEFLVYNTNLGRFEIFAAADGYYYGTSDQISIPSPGTRIVARYDSTFRRLALRSGYELRLYRFAAYLGTSEDDASPPSSFSLSAYPNPFNPTATISFAMPREANLRLALFDVTGREVRVLEDRRFAAGEHAVSFDGSALPTGIYFVRLESPSFQQTQKLVLLK